MFLLKEIPSTVAALFSAILPGFIMMVWSYIRSAFVRPKLTLVIDSSAGSMTRNQVFAAAKVYLLTKIGSSIKRLRVSKTSRERDFTVAIENGEDIVDTFRDVELKWHFVHIEPKENSREKHYFELTFKREAKAMVFDYYLPHILDEANAINEREKVVKLYNPQCPGGNGRGQWGNITLKHPATFDTLAMEPKLKKEIIDDLDRFRSRKEFYNKVGKVWKRGYLLYGPPGTGKSSLVAAMANYLKFDIYDLELTSIYRNDDLRRILSSTTNRSIVVIDDIDCNLYKSESHKPEFTISGLLNFIDGLWSGCGDERIFVFTTNNKDQLEDALKRPGRMDMHIEMSYCTRDGFKLLASNYLPIRDGNSNDLYREIEGLIDKANVTPAEVAEELLKSEDANVAFQGLANLLKRKLVKSNAIKNEGC